MYIYLVRHGETNGNRDKIVQTPITPLSDTGQQQAKELAVAYQHHAISKILCSDHTRTQQTAEPVHQLLKCELVLSELLQERNLGMLRGIAYTEIKDDFLAPDYQPEKGESQIQFGQRVEEAWLQIIEHADSTPSSLMVMTHGLVLRYILEQILKIDEGQLMQVGFENTCVTQIDKSDFSKIEMLCDFSHLKKPVVEGGVI